MTFQRGRYRTHSGDVAIIHTITSDEDFPLLGVYEPDGGDHRFYCRWTMDGYPHDGNELLILKPNKTKIWINVYDTDTNPSVDAYYTEERAKRACGRNAIAKALAVEFDV